MFQNFISKSSSVHPCINSFLDSIDNESIDSQASFPFEPKKNKEPLDFDDFKNAFSSSFPQNPSGLTLEEEDIKTDDLYFIPKPKPNKKKPKKKNNPSLEISIKQEKKSYFKVVSEPKDSLFTKLEKGSIFTKTETSPDTEEEEKNFLGRKRMPVKRPRKDNSDNIRKKIKRGFLNDALINQLNRKLKGIKSRKYFRKFPQTFSCDINKKRINGILNLSLGEIFQKEELYAKENETGLNNFKHNLNVVQSEEIKENEEFNKILKKTFSELYEEYINSDEFQIGVIKKLKKKKMKDDYIQRFKFIARTLIEFFSL